MCTCCVCVYIQDPPEDTNGHTFPDSLLWLNEQSCWTRVFPSPSVPKRTNSLPTMPKPCSEAHYKFNGSSCRNTCPGPMCDSRRGRIKTTRNQRREKRKMSRNGIARKNPRDKKTVLLCTNFAHVGNPKMCHLPHKSISESPSSPAPWCFFRKSTVPVSISKTAPSIRGLFSALKFPRLGCCVDCDSDFRFLLRLAANPTAIFEYGR